MLMPASWSERAKDDIDGLGDTPTADEARVVTGKYEPVDMAAAIIEKHGEGGGGGGSADLDVLGFNYYGNMTSEAGGTATIPVSQALIPWDVSDASSYPGQAAHFFDLTDPTQPVVIDDGIYEIAAEASYVGASVTGKPWRLFAFFDLDGVFDGPGIGGTLEYDEGEAVLPQLCVSGTRKLLAGMKVGVRIAQYSGGSATFKTWIQVQRVA